RRRDDDGHARGGALPAQPADSLRGRPAVIWIYAAALALLAVHGAHRALLTILALRDREPALAPTVRTVTVQLPLYNEEAVAARLIEAVGALDWPADRLEIQILDDSTDATREVCAAAAARLRARGLDVQH